MKHSQDLVGSMLKQLFQIVEARSAIYVHTSRLITLLKIKNGESALKRPLTKDNTSETVNYWNYCHYHFSFFHFHFLSSVPTSCQQHHGKPRISQLLFTEHRLPHVRSHSLGREHASLLSSFLHLSLCLELLVNDLRWLIRTFMMPVLFYICWLSKKSG